MSAAAWGQCGRGGGLQARGGAGSLSDAQGTRTTAGRGACQLDEDMVSLAVLCSPRMWPDGTNGSGQGVLPVNCHRLFRQTSYSDSPWLCQRADPLWPLGPGREQRPRADSCSAGRPPQAVCLWMGWPCGVGFAGSAHFYASQGIELEFTKSVPSVHFYTGEGTRGSPQGFSQPQPECTSTRDTPDRLAPLQSLTCWL